MEEINILELLRILLIFDSRDWGTNPTDAWLYGIIVGWESESEDMTEAIYKEFSNKFRWNRATWNKLLFLHNKYEEAQKRCRNV